jgi:LemA protein
MDIILIILAVVVVSFLIMGYNKLVRLIEAVKNSEKEISVQLDRRGKIFDSLISAVKKYMEHEDSVLTKVTALRQQTVNNNASPEEKKIAQEELSKLISNGSLQSSINLTMENYPDLKSNTNMLQLQEEIVSTENKLSFSKKGYNNAIESYYVTKNSFPTLILPKIFANLNKEFVYWELTSEQITIEETRRVSF